MASRERRVSNLILSDPDDDWYELHWFLLGTHVDIETLEEEDDKNDYLMKVEISIPKFIPAWFNDDDILKKATLKVNA